VLFYEKIYIPESFSGPIQDVIGTIYKSLIDVDLRFRQLFTVVDALDRACGDLENRLSDLETDLDVSRETEEL